MIKSKITSRVTKYSSSSTVFFLVIFLLVLECSFRLADGVVQIGPPIRSLIKPAIHLRKQGVFLAEYSDYSVSLNWKEKKDEGDEAKPEEEEGEFFVRAPTNYGIMVVIQFLRFRTQFRGPSLKKLDEVCRDYIKFSDTRSKETAEICGYLYFRDNNMTPEKLLGPRTFYSANGEVNVKVFIDKSTAGEMTEPLWNTVQIIFTAVTECNSEDSSSNQSLRPCYPNASNTNINVPKANCISSSLFCDEVFNCGFEGQAVGGDELDCVTNNYGKSPIKQGINPNDINKGSVSVLMILCICIGVIIVAVFIGAYAVSELNLSCSTCPFLARSRLQQANSNTRISKSAEVDVSTSSRTTSNYSTSFTPDISHVK